MLRFSIYIILIGLFFWLNLAWASTGWIDFALADFFVTNSESKVQMLLYDFRIPAALSALISGAGLAVAGLLLQVLFQNPLAGPGVLGVGSGAALSISISILLGIGTGLALPFFGVLGAMAVLGLILFASVRLKNATGLLIFGLMLGFISSAAITVIEYMAEAQRLQHFVYWTMGSYDAVSPSSLYVLIPLVLVILIVTWMFSAQLDRLLIGEERMAGAGFSVRPMRIFCLASAGLMVGLVTAYCGPLAFIGLAAPHIARLLSPSDVHRHMIPHTIGVGMVLSLLALLIVHTSFFGIQLPLNAVLSLFGAPVVIWLVLGSAKRHNLS